MVTCMITERREAICEPVETLERFVRTILNGFESYFADFQNITLAATSRFENADWVGMRMASIHRIDLYKAKTATISEYVELIAGDELRDLDFWRAARERYSELIEGHSNFEIAETFFNSMYCSVFKHRKIRDEYAFVFSPLGDMPPSDVSKVYRIYQLDCALDELLDKIHGFWLGQLVGNYMGFPFENVYVDEPIPFLVDRYYTWRDDASIRMNRDDLRGYVPILGGMFEGAPLLLLHHSGARTGTQRVTPLMYQAVPGGYAVFASKAGADSNPDWYYNVTANSETKVEIGSESLSVTARVAGGEEHDAIWSRQKQEWPQFAEYEQQTARDVIPVVVLERA